jgi:hypothetical protein
MAASRQIKGSTMIRTLMVAVILLLASGSVSAQDTLFTDRERVFTAYVYDLDHFSVWYYTVNGSDTESHRIRKGSLLQIAYEDGGYMKRLSARKMARLRKIVRPVKPPRLRGYDNALTLNLPAYNTIGNYPGVSVGAEYTRFIDKGGRYSAALSFQKLWAGTAETGELRPGETRANIRGALFVPSAFYHPLGNKDVVDLGLGLALPIGTLSRADASYLNSSYYQYSQRTSHMLIGLLAQVNVTFQTTGRFIFTLYGSYGLMLPVGNTSGSFGQAGFKLGSRF